MSRHNGVVTSVKFSPSGRFLASGSDDKIVLIWEKDEEQNRAKQFGETEADLEHWTVLKRLVAHDNDIQDICWSPDGSLLVTVGLDRSIIIWNGNTFERIKRYDIHQSMVKGIVFDPANKFFATASDDRTLRIFRYYNKMNESSMNSYEFQMEHIVMEPFKKSPLTTYFRRMSWSPDGQHIAVPNATNGPVSSVAIINRGNWGTDISLIGHEAPCEVCSFSPRLFRSDDQIQVQKRTNDKSNKNFSTILATAGQDQTLAIWSTSQTKPLVVAADIVTNSVTDICWSPDGEKLFLSCQDGSITVVIFEQNELGEIVSADVNELQLHRYGADRESTVFAESTDQLILEAKADKESHELVIQPSIREAKPIEKEVEVKKSASPSLITSKSIPKPDSSPVVTPKQLVQNITITKDGKKRVAPLLVSSSSSSKNRALKKATTDLVSSNKFEVGSKLSQTSYFLPRLGIQTSVHGLKSRNAVSSLNVHSQNLNEDHDNDNEDMGIDLNNDTPNQQNQNIFGASLKKKNNKMKRQLLEKRYPNCFKMVSNLPEILFNNKYSLINELDQVLNTKDGADLITSSSLDSVDEDLMFQVIVNGIKHFKKVNVSIESTNASTKLTTSIIEVRNGPLWNDDDEELIDPDYSDKVDFQDPTVVTVTNDELQEYKKYTLYFPYKIQHVLPVVIDGLLVYYVLVSFMGTVQIIFAESGAYASPSFELGENVIMIKQRNEFLMCLTNSGLFYSWKFPHGKSPSFIQGLIRGVSIATILNSEAFIKVPESSGGGKRAAEIPIVASKSVKTIDINGEDGSPYVVLEDSLSIYSYSIDLKTWTKVVDAWYYFSLTEEIVEGLKKDNQLNFLIRRNFYTYQDDIKRMKAAKYDFESKARLMLRDVMRERFKENIGIAN